MTKSVLISVSMPPSVNEYLAVVRGRLIKTKVFREFLVKALQEIKHDIYFKNQKAILKTWIHQDLTLDLNCYFFWSPDKVFTKGIKAMHKVKKKDVSNRVKPLHDAIAEAFDIDDMFFFKHSEEKCTDDRNLNPYVLIEIKPHKPRTIHDVMRELNGN